MAITYGQNFARLLEPGLRKIFLESYAEKPEQYSQFMNVLSSKKSIETDLRMSGFGIWGEKGSLDSTSYETPGDTDVAQYKHVTFSKGFIVDKELVDDEQYGQIQKMSKALARAARATIEKEAASILNNAFTAGSSKYNNVIDSGNALISGTHKLLGTGANTVTGTTTTGTGNLVGNLSLNESNLELAMKLARQQVDEKGIKIQMKPDILIVPPSLEYTAMKIVKSGVVPVASGGAGASYTAPLGTLGSNTAAANLTGDYNPFQGGIKVVVLDYLTSDSNWFVVDSAMNPLNFFWREKLTFKSDNNFDTDAAKYKGRMRFSLGASDWRGIIGSGTA